MLTRGINPCKHICTNLTLPHHHLLHLTHETLTLISATMTTLHGRRHYRRSNRSNTVRHSRWHRNSTIFNLLHHCPQCSIRTRDELRPMADASSKSRNLHPTTRNTPPQLRPSSLRLHCKSASSRYHHH